MSGLLAPPGPILRRRSTMEALALDAALELGAGGEARVLAVPGDESLVAKLYHEPTLAKARKVALMMADEPVLDASAATLAWPRDLLLEAGGGFAGFLMRRAEGRASSSSTTRPRAATARRGATTPCSTASAPTWPPPSRRCTRAATSSATSTSPTCWCGPAAR